MDFSLEALKALPGAAGSVVSALFIKDVWPRRIAMVLAGTALAYYVTPWLRKMVDLDAGAAGFLLGLTGMLFVAKIFAIWEALELGVIARDFIRQILRLPPKEQ